LYCIVDYVNVLYSLDGEQPNILNRFSFSIVQLQFLYSFPYFDSALI